MKQSTPWRLLVPALGASLGLLGTLGMSAPAAAAVSAASTPSIQHHDDDGDGYRDDAELALSQEAEDEIRVEGTGYEDNSRVRVWLVQFDDDDYDADVADYRRVWTDDDGEFDFTEDGLDCGYTYQAFSFSHDDGWVKSDKLDLDCDD
jgi:hypothetical protein